MRVYECVCVRARVYTRMGVRVYRGVRVHVGDCVPVRVRVCVSADVHGLA